MAESAEPIRQQQLYKTKGRASGCSADSVRTLVVTDVRLYEEGLVHSLGDRSELSVCGVASGSVEALARIADLHPDVVLLDVTMHDSLVLARTITQLTPSVHVVAFAVSDSDEDVLACAEAGVAGYVTRSGSCDQLIAVLRSVARGELLCSPRVAARLFRLAAERRFVGASADTQASLTSRELDVVRLVARGLSNKEVARELRIEVSTVKNHVHRVLEKLHLDRRTKVGALMRADPLMRLPI
jgi:DNA-binding NarL/FixJ family response regulator